MVMIYVRWIKAGKMTLKEVPSKWRDAVEEMINKE